MDILDDSASGDLKSRQRKWYTARARVLALDLVAVAFLIAGYYVWRHGSPAPLKVAGMSLFLVTAIATSLLFRRSTRQRNRADRYPIDTVGAGRVEWVKRHNSAVSGTAIACLVVFGAIGLLFDIPVIWPILAFAVGFGVFVGGARVEQAAGRASAPGLLCKLVGIGMVSAATIVITEHFVRLLLLS